MYDVVYLDNESYDTIPKSPELGRAAEVGIEAFQSWF